MEPMLNSKTFFVKEIFNPKLSENGKYCYYTVEKKDISHKQLMRMLPRDSCFSGIKDRNATTEQWFCSKERLEDFKKDGIKVKYKGRSNEKLFIGKHKANHFRVIANEKPIGKPGLVANYFGEQRFDLRARKFYELIHNNSFEEALKYFLTEKSKFDSEKSEQMKKIIFDTWGKWKVVRESEEIKGTGKEDLFKFLERKPKDFEEAFEYAERKSLVWMLKACQAIRFNQKLNEIVFEKNPKSRIVKIYGEKVFIDANKAMKRELIIEPTEFEERFGLGKLERKSFFEAKKYKVKIRGKEIEISFELPRGCYATVLLKAIY